jgi:hypothetical protein
LAPGARSVVAASSLSLLANWLALAVAKTGLLTNRKSCAPPSASGRKSPLTPSTFSAMPRGSTTLSSRMSPGLVETRSAAA